MSKIDVGMYVKMGAACLIASAAFFIVYGLLVFAVAKLAKKPANLKNVMVSANLNAFVMMATFIAFAIGIAINTYLGIGILMAGNYAFVLFTYEYLRVKFDLKKAILVYVAPLVVIVGSATGSYITAKVLAMLMS
jgi:hypothetical protein